MICPTCKKEGKKSKVFIGVGMTTMLYCQPFYDEDGKYHHHDLNTTTTQYTCSNKHHWSEKTQSECWCGWPNIKIPVYYNEAKEDEMPKM